MFRCIRPLCGLFAVAAISIPSYGALVVHYTFDEASGPAINQGTAGAAANGTFNGAATRSNNTPSGLGYSLDTNGGSASDYLTAGDVEAIDAIGGKFTLVAWINLQADPSDGDGIITKGTHGNGFSWQIEKPSTGTISAQNFRLDIHVDYGGSLFSADITSGDIDKWLFVAVSYNYQWVPSPDPTVHVYHYLGDMTTPVALIGSATHTTMDAPNGNDGDLRVGSSTRAADARSPDALIDDVRIYNEILTLEQLEAIRLSMVPEPTAIGLAGIGCTGLALRRRRAVVG